MTFAETIEMTDSGIIMGASKRRRKTMAYRMAVFDVDGTLWDLKTNRVPDSSIRSIAEMKKRGVLFVIASARTVYGLGDALLSLAPDYFIACNGGVLADRSGKILFHRDMSEADCDALAALADDADAGLLLKFPHHMYLYRAPEKFDWLEGQMNSDIGRDKFRTDFTCAKHHTQLPQCGCIQGDAGKIRAFAASSETLSFYPYSEHGFDVAPLLSTKGSGLLELMKLLSIRKEETIAFGDGTNDLDMIKEAGTGVAMGNAVPALKEAADYVTAAVDEEGIRKALLHFGLIQQ